MIKHVTILFLLILTCNVCYGKKSSIQFTIKSAAYHAPIDSIIIKLSNNKGKTWIGSTNSNGVCIIENVTGTEITVNIESNKEFEGRKKRFNNTTKKDGRFTFYLKYTRELERNYFETIYSRYDKDSSINNDNYSPENLEIAKPEHGIIGLSKHISRTIEYPEKCLNANIQGKITLSFLIQKDGTVTDVNVLNGGVDCLNEEAIRVVKYLPKWEPGKVDGVPVITRVTTPIKFAI